MKKGRKDGWKMGDGMFFGEYNLEGANSLKEYLITAKFKIQDKTFREINGILKLLKPKITRDRILVFPCNYGRIAIGLSKRGYDITGVDEDKEQIKMAYELARKNGAMAVFMYRKPAQIDFKEEFDIIIVPIYSFGFFKRSITENIIMAHKAYQSLRHGGRLFLLFDRNPLVIAHGYCETMKEKLNNGKKIFMEEKYNAKNDKIEGRYLIRYPGGKIKKDYYSVRLIYQKNIAKLCKTSGFINLRFYGDLKGNPYGPSSDNLIMIAEKK